MPKSTIITDDWRVLEVGPDGKVRQAERERARKKKKKKEMSNALKSLLGAHAYQQFGK